MTPSKQRGAKFIFCLTTGGGQGEIDSERERRREKGRRKKRNTNRNEIQGTKRKEISLLAIDLSVMSSVAPLTLLEPSLTKREIFYATLSLYSMHSA